MDHVKFLQPVVVTRTRIRVAYSAAVLTDAIQWVLGPIGWAFADELLDVIAAIVITRAIGFHPLLLPTFVLEIVPVADLLPTWTGCVALVLALRKNERSAPDGPVIDVEGKRVV